MPADLAGLAAGDGVGSGSGATGPTETVQAPARKEVGKFTTSEDWVDMLKAVRHQILSTVGMGLKIVAPWSGLHWRDADADGEVSLGLYHVMTVTDLDSVARQSFEKPAQAEARAMLLCYNGDGCRLVVHVRNWLDLQHAATDLSHGGDLPVP